jgi:hypothetical protein
MTRDILDQYGNVIGNLTLPDETSEEMWAEKLAEYLPKTIEVSPIDMVRSNMEFGKELIAEFGSEAETNALDTDQTANLIGLLAPIQMMLLTGAIQTACIYLQSTDLTGILSPGLVAKYISKMNAYTGVAQ